LYYNVLSCLIDTETHDINNQVLQFLHDNSCLFHYMYFTNNFILNIRMTRSIDYIIPKSGEYYKQNLYEFRIRSKGIVFTYTNNYFKLINILAYNALKKYTLSDIYIENISDATFVDLISKYSEDKSITLEDIRDILIKHNCQIDLMNSREHEWDFMSYTKWIVCK